MPSRRAESRDRARRFHRPGAVRLEPPPPQQVAPFPGGTPPVASGPRSSGSARDEQVAREVPVPQVQEHTLQRSAKIDAPWVHHRSAADRIERLALMDVSVETERRLTILDEGADRRRADVVEEDLSPDRSRLQVLVELRGQVEAGVKGRGMDVEDRLLGIAHPPRGPVDHLLEVDLLEVAGSSTPSPRSSPARRSTAPT